jgi:hypothetical protein
VKKSFVGFIVAAIIPLAAFAQDANRMSYVELFPLANYAGSRTNSTVTGVDVSAYKGNATVVCAYGKGSVAAATSLATMQHCATTNGTYTTVTNYAGTAITFTHVGGAAAVASTKPLDLARVKKYVRVVVNHGADTNAAAVMLVAPMKSE